jgi:hypothetical protein
LGWFHPHNERQNMQGIEQFGRVLRRPVIGLNAAEPGRRSPVANDRPLRVSFTVAEPLRQRLLRGNFVVPDGGPVTAFEADELRVNRDRSRYVASVFHPGGAVFGKCIVKLRREFEPGKVVAICDHLGFLGGSQLKSEIAREAVPVRVVSTAAR